MALPQNLQLDPVKKDYVVENGQPVASDRIQEATYYALAIPRGQWIYGAPDQGSLLYTLQNQMHSDSTEQQFASYAEDAVQRQLVARGQASAVRAGNVQVTRTGSVNQVQVVAAESQLSDQLNFQPV